MQLFDHKIHNSRTQRYAQNLSLYSVTAHRFVLFFDSRMQGMQVECCSAGPQECLSGFGWLRWLDWFVPIFKFKLFLDAKAQTTVLSLSPRRRIILFLKYNAINRCTSHHHQATTRRFLFWNIQIQVGMTICGWDKGFIGSPYHKQTYLMFKRYFNNHHTTIE